MLRKKYSSSLNDMFTDHGLQGSGLLHDAELHLNQMHIEAWAASGDCFETLASELDRISETMSSMTPQHVKLELEKLSRILFYLQQHYIVKSKKSL